MKEDVTVIHQSSGAVWTGRWAWALIPYPTLILINHTVSVDAKQEGRKKWLSSRHSFFDVRHELRKWRAHIAGQRTQAWAETVGDCVFCIQFLESPLTKLSWKVLRKYSSTCDVSTYFLYIQARATFQFDQGLSASVTDTIKGHHFWEGRVKYE